MAPRRAGSEERAEASPTEQIAAVLKATVDAVDKLTDGLAQLQASQTRSQEAGTSGSSGSASRHASYKPKEIPVFKGDPRQLRVWQARARQWLARYPTDSDQAGMLGDHLDFAPFQRYLQMCRTAQEPVTAEQVFAMLERHFADPMETSRAIYQFQQLKQGSMTVIELSNKLDELAWTPGCEDLRTDLLMRERFLSALNPEIAELLTRDRLSFRTKDEAVLQAVLQERNLQASRRYERYEERGEAESPQQQEAGSGPETGNKVQLAALKLLQKMHAQGQLPGVTEETLAALQAKRHWSHTGRPSGAKLVAGQSGKVEETNQCWDCQQWGHRRFDCPTPKKENK